MGEENVFVFVFSIHCKSWATKAAFPLPGQENSYTTGSQHFRGVFRAALGPWPQVTSTLPLLADEMPLKCNRKYVITEVFVNFHTLPRVGEIPTCLSSFGGSSGATVSSPRAPRFKVLTHGGL